MIAAQSSFTDGPFRVIIIGAGVAGLTAAISLRKTYASDTVHIAIYEQASELREVGASIGIQPSGLRALDKLGVRAAFDDSNAVWQSGSIPYQHWQTGDVIFREEATQGLGGTKFNVARYHRAHLQRVLLEALPADVPLNFGMRVKAAQGVSVQNQADGGELVRVCFEDGSTAEADLLLGADGIHSKVRRSFVPGHELRWGGLIAFRATFDASLVADVPGLPRDACWWVGHERRLLVGGLGKNQYAIVSLHTCDPTDENHPYHKAKWDEAADLALFKGLYKGWDSVAERIVNAAPYIKAYPNLSGAPLPSLTFSKRVILLGDAGHPHGGAFAAGGSLAINDAYAVTLALAHVWPPGSLAAKPTAAQLQRALRLYDATRRPLVNRLLDIVHSPARRGALRPDKGDGETEEELLARVSRRPNMKWLTEHVVEKEFMSVVSRDQILVV